MAEKSREQRQQERAMRRQKSKERRRIMRERRKTDPMYRIPTDHDWMFVYTGTESDIMSYFSVLLLNPAFIFYGIIFLTGRVYSLVLMYVIVDGITIGAWTIAALVQRRRQKWWDAMTPQERHDYYQRLIDTLDEEEESIPEKK